MKFPPLWPGSMPTIFPASGGAETAGVGVTGGVAAGWWLAGGEAGEPAGAAEPGEPAAAQPAAARAMAAAPRTSAARPAGAQPRRGRPSQARL